MKVEGNEKQTSRNDDVRDGLLYTDTDMIAVADTDTDVRDPWNKPLLLLLLLLLLLVPRCGWKSKFPAPCSCSAMPSLGRTTRRLS